MARDTALNSDDVSLRTSNGNYYGVEESWKGFYGLTKLYYGPGENDFYICPPKEKNPNDNVFEFFDNNFIPCGFCPQGISYLPLYRANLFDTVRVDLFVDN